MIKKLLFTVAFSVMVTGLFAQTIDDSFFEKVDYIGAFGDTDWTLGWTNWDPNNTDYPTPTTTKGNGDFSQSGGIKITTDETWSGNILLDGWVYVEDGATLTIDAGTIIRGTKGAALIVERGGKLIAEGTQDSPIVFTSNSAAGERQATDWAGIILCGKAVNNKGTSVTIEGGTEAEFGGTDNEDNSGSLKYVRIEFTGYDVDGNGNEINGLTMGSIGNGTTIDYVQVSYSGDDSYEWFGGTVNCSHLIAYGTQDDDFDTDNGYVGHVQFALAVRDSTFSETNDDSRGFESDNDASGSAAKPYTEAVFSNFTLLGPGNDESGNGHHGYGMLIRRNSRLQVYNSVCVDYSKGGLVIDGSVTQQAANDDSLNIEYNIIAGRSPLVKAPSSQLWSTSEAQAWVMDDSRHNDTTNTISDLMITYPNNYTSPTSFLPETGSPLLTGSYWYYNGGSAIINTQVNSVKVYPNPVSDVLTIDNSITVKSVTVVNTLGQTIKQINAESNTVNLNDIEPGVYMIVVKDNNSKVYNQRIIKK